MGINIMKHKKTIFIWCCIFMLLGCTSTHQKHENKQSVDHKSLYYDWLISKEYMFESNGKKYKIDKFVVEDLNGDGILDLLIQNDETKAQGVCSILNNTVVEIRYNLFAGIITSHLIYTLQNEAINTEEEIYYGNSKNSSVYKYVKNQFDKMYIVNNHWLLNATFISDSPKNYNGILFTFTSNILPIDFTNFNSEQKQAEEDFQNKMIENYGYMSYGGEIWSYYSNDSQSFNQINAGLTLTPYLKDDLTYNTYSRIQENGAYILSAPLNEEEANRISIDFSTGETGENIKSIKEINYSNYTLENLNKLLTDK